MLSSCWDILQADVAVAIIHKMEDDSWFLHRFLEILNLLGKLM